LRSQGELGGNSPAIKRHFDLQIMTLQNAPRDADKLKAVLRAKQRERSGRGYDRKELCRVYL
jgi:hypothetical protein